MYLKLQGTHLQAVFKYTSKFQINDAELNTSKSTKTKQKQKNILRVHLTTFTKKLANILQKLSNASSLFI